ncbi:MAG: DoxX family protein [Sandaracinus sp.]
MKARSLAYWITTLVFALAIGASGIGDLVRAPAIVEGLGQLGYPAYLMLLLGVWKLLGVAAILAPGAPRLKEWAYAGFFFELTGAAFSHVAAGVGSPVAPLALAALAAASWALRPEGRTLGTPIVVLPKSAPLAPTAA